MAKTEPKPTKEEILKSKFKSSFLDLDYLELYLEAMQEYAEQFHNEKMREESVLFANWLDKLTPSERTSVWSKDGQYSGLFTMDNEQLYNKYLKTKE